MAESSRKRKHATDHGSLVKRPRFPQKLQHSIATTSTRNAYPQGEVNVKNFLKSHENEIKSLEHAMRAAKQGLTRRAFQDVPRELRRRTASHNPQRVPRRLQARSRQEAKDDNTPISKGTSGSGTGKGKSKFLRKAGAEKSRQCWEQRATTRRAKTNLGLTDDSRTNQKPVQCAVPDGITEPPRQPKRRRNIPALATPATPPSRFRKRQRDKTWLPTHVWHSKRARMTSPKDPLWRFAIPLQPVVKAYRLTHRAATQRGAVAWDASYMSTLGLQGEGASIVGLLKSLHFAAGDKDDPWQDRGRAKKWRLGTRTWDGWLYEREAKPPRKIAQVTIVWCATEVQTSKKKVFIRVHPSAFSAVWDEVIRNAKVQKPHVLVQDLRFEIGSIEIVGPSAAETLTSILVPSCLTDAANHSPSVLWGQLASVADVASLPAGALLAFDIRDPRLRDPSSSSRLPGDQTSLDTLTEVLASWPIDTTQTGPSIFSQDARRTAARSMASQKAINRRKSECTLGDYPEPEATDAPIPMMTYTCRDSNSWTVLLPWKCVMAVWRSTMRYPLSTGGNPRFGGLKERRQVDFERSLPSFPYDFPGTDAGWAWELGERAARKCDWTRLPRGKRIEWATIDLGNGRKGEIGEPWACEWERLLPDGSKIAHETFTAPRVPFEQLSRHRATEISQGEFRSAEHRHGMHLVTVKISMASRGRLTECARIYRLPRNNSELRSKWLALMPQAEKKVPGKKIAGKKQAAGTQGDMPAHVRHRALAGALLEDGAAKAGAQEYPVVPDEEDLIGFVTTGNYNLREGKPTAVGNVVVERAMEQVMGGDSGEERVCIVRQAGMAVGRLAWWDVV